ncbi:MAG: P-II family nitrogen regulator [Vicingaceae bacterium]|nr:P-II family nitrogen regulator [Flavobacteriales bacterium]MDF1674687.1 P-II family nitrogen regulator [Vicingaceae bacterium]
MKEIQAFIRPEKLNDIYKALEKEGHCCLTIFNGEGTGKYTDQSKDWPSFKHPFLHSKMVKIEMVCKKEAVKKVTEIIQESGSTGESGDGLIYVSDVEEVIRIRDGAKGIETLHS